MDSEPPMLEGSREGDDLRSRLEGLRLDADYLEYRVEQVRGRTELRTVFSRLVRTALWTGPIIWLGLKAATPDGAWPGWGVWKAWFGWIGSMLFKG